MRKKLTAVISIFLTFVMVLPLSVFADTETFALGDVDHDGKISDWDAVLLERYLAGWDVTIDTDNADMTGDGLTNELDAAYLARYLAGWYGSSDDLAKRVLHVTSDGDDENGDGSARAPFASIERAQAKVRELLSDGAKGGITVYLHEGEYIYYEALNFDETSGGTEDCPVTYAAYGNDEVRISGVDTLDMSLFEKAPESITQYIRDENARDKIYMYDLAQSNVHNGIEYKNGADESFLLYSGDTKMDIARYPNRVGQTKEIYTPFVDPGRDDRGFYFIEESGICGNWSFNNSDIKLKGFITVDYAMWSISFYGFDAETNKVYVSEQPRQLRFFYYNVLEELDYPGEYFIDPSTNTLYVYSDNNLENTEISFIRNNGSLVRIGGEDASSRAEYLNFNGIKFVGGKEHLIFGYANHISFTDCVFTNGGNNAIDVKGENNLVEFCEVSNMGGTGVELHSTRDDADLIGCGNIVRNNEIHDFALIHMTYNPGVYSTGNGTIVSHNEIYNTSHNAILGGGADCVYSYNYIHNCCYQTHDGGAIYIGGYNSPTYIMYNYIQSNMGTVMGAPKGIYIDDGGSNFFIYGNIVNCSGGVGILMGGGSNNLVQNNIIVGSAINYDKRGYFDDWQNVHGIYGPYSGKTSVDGGYNYYWNNLYGPQTAKWDYQLWNIRYPMYAQYKSSNVKDETDKYLIGVCGGVTIKDNVCIWENPEREQGVAGVGFATKSNISNPCYLNGDVSGYIRYYTIAEVGFADYEANDLSLRDDSKLYEDLPGFKDIPFGEIGIEGRYVAGSAK